jgi:predicted GTPase
VKKLKKSFDDLSKHEKRRKRNLAKLARRTKTIKREGKNIGMFGMTSTGKSTMVNSLLGKKVADTGVGETTKEITPYQGKGYTVWDAPGRNDELTYSNKKYISFIKGLTRRLILIQCTIKENLDLMHLLDDIVVNKFDDVDEDERRKFQHQIQREISSFGLKRKKNVFFLSAQYPQMFPDWLQMVDYLTEECIDCK